MWELTNTFINFYFKSSEKKFYFVLAHFWYFIFFLFNLSTILVSQSAKQCSLHFSQPHFLSFNLLTFKSFTSILHSEVYFFLSVTITAIKFYFLVTLVFLIKVVFACLTHILSLWEQWFIYEQIQLMSFSSPAKSEPAHKHFDFFSVAPITHKH
jgi:hypothetical protein